MAVILVYVSMVIDLDVLLPQIGSVQESFDEAKNKYLKDHRVHEKDARITIYSYCCGAIESALLYLIFRNYELPTDTWWDSLPKKFQGSGISKPPIRKPSLELLRKRVDHYWSTSFFILLFSSFESSARIIVRATYHGKFNDGRGNVKDILKCLLVTNFSKYECLLELLRLVYVYW